MKATEQIKQRLFKLIQKSDDEHRLEMVYQILDQETIKQNDEVKLLPKQKQELLKAYEESWNEENLIDHETLVKENSKWLENKVHQACE